MHQKNLVSLEVLKKGVKLGELTAYDMDSFFNRTILIGQKLLVEDSTMLSHELCAYPASLIDQYGDLRQGTKSSLMAKLAVYITDQPVPDVEIADGNALLYHITWPQEGTVSVIAKSMGLRSGTTNYHPPLALSSHKIIVCQDRYLEVSPKSHERSKRKGANTPPEYELKLSTTLPPRDHIMRSTTNKKVFHELLSKCSMGEGIEVTGEQYRDYDHEEADITMVSYALEKLSNGAKNVFVTTDDTDVLILLMYFIHKTKPTGNIYMKRFDGRVTDVKASTTMLGPKCSQLLGLHSVSGCDTNGYFFRKGKLNALRLLQNNDYPLLHSMLGEETSSQVEVVQAGMKFLYHLYGEKGHISTCENLRLKIYQRYKCLL